jgi:DNA-binding response OmpR family regulator
MAARRPSPRVLWVGAAGPEPALRDALRDHGYALLHVDAEGASFARRGAALPADAVVLAGAYGVDIDEAADAVGRWRGALPAAVLLVLLPQPTPLHEVRLLEAGADAVAARRGGSLVWLARLRRLLRRREPALAALPGALNVDVQACRVQLCGRTLALGSTAVALMDELARHQGAPAPRERLLRHLGPGAARDRSRTLDMTICRLRDALRSQGVRALEIESVRGVGYRLVPRHDA